MRNGQIMTSTVDALVVALCADFARRKRILERKTSSYPVIMECRFLNYRMLDAAAEIVGESLAEVFIREIGERVGYSSTNLTHLSESVYKARKIEVKEAIAKRLCLV